MNLIFKKLKLLSSAMKLNIQTGRSHKSIAHKTSLSENHKSLKKINLGFESKKKSNKTRLQKSSKSGCLIMQSKTIMSYYN